MYGRTFKLPGVAVTLLASSGDVAGATDTTVGVWESCTGTEPGELRKRSVDGDRGGGGGGMTGQTAGNVFARVVVGGG